MAKTIYLRLALQWSEDQSTWEKVTPTSPVTEIDPGEEVDWVADSASIRALRITPDDGGNIIVQVRDNNSNAPKGDTNPNATPNDSQSYVISVQPAGGGGFQEYDPEIRVKGNT